MYELDGKQYTLEQIQTLLNEENYKSSIDDFIAEKGYTKVSQEDPTKQAEDRVIKKGKEDLREGTTGFNLAFNEEEQVILDNFFKIGEDTDLDEITQNIRRQKKRAIENQLSSKQQGKSVGLAYNPSVFNQENLDLQTQLNEIDSYIPNEQEIEEEKNIIKTNKRNLYLRDLDSETRKSIAAKLKGQVYYGSTELNIVPNEDYTAFENIDAEFSDSTILNDLKNIAVVNDKEELVGGQLYDIDKQITNLEKSVLEAEKTGQLSSANLDAIIAEYDSLVNQKNNLINNYEDLTNEYLALNKELISDTDALNFFRRNYSDIEKARLATLDVILKLPLAVIEIGDLSSSLVGSIFDSDILDEYKNRKSEETKRGVFKKLREGRKGLLNAISHLQKERELYIETPIKLSEIRNTTDFLRYASHTLFEVAPYTAMSFTGLNTATALFTLSGMGEKASQLGLNEELFRDVNIEDLQNMLVDESTDDKTKKFIEDQLELYNNEVNQNQFKKLTSIFLFGLAESLPNRFIGSIRIAEGIKKTLAYQGTSVSKSLATKAGIGTLIMPGLEAVDEGFTQWGQNLIDIYFYNKDISWAENMDEAMVKGIIGGTKFSAAQMSGMAYGVLLNTAQTLQDKKIMKSKVEELTGFLKTLDKGGLQREERKIIQEQANILKNEILVLSELSIRKLQNLEVDQIKELADIDRQTNKIYKEFALIKKFNNLDKKTLVNLYKKFQQKLDVLHNKKSDILGTVTRADETIVDELSSEELQNVANEVNNSGYLFSGLPISNILPGVTVTGKKVDKKDIKSGKTGETEIKGEVLTETVEAPLTKKEQRKKKREEKQKQKEKEKEKKKANELASDYDNLDAAGVQDLLTQYQSIALDALGYSPGKGTVTQEDAIAFVNAEFSSIMDRFDPNESQFSTWVTANIAPKAPSLYGKQEGLEEAGQTTSLDDERAQQVADPTTVETVESVTTETVTPTINVFGKGPEAEVLESQTVGAIQESELGRKIQSAETIEISDLNTLNEEVSAPILAEELNIPVEVITDPKLNINNQHNPSNIQRFILRNAQTVLGVLKANTNVEVVGSLKNPEVKIKVGGKPLKLPRKLLDLFFDKTDIRVGNNFQYKLKPNLTIKDIQTSVGILNGKVDPDFINRSGEAQTAKAILTLLSRVRTNAALEGITTGEVAGTILSTTPEKVKTAVDRAIDYLKGIEGKYSGTLATGISPGPVAKALRVGLETFQSVYNKTKDFAKALSAYIKKVISGLKITNAEEKKIVADVLTEYVKVDNIDAVDLDSMINDLVEKLNISRGIAYEKVVYKNAEGIKSPIFKVTGTQTEKGKAPDIQFEIAGQKFDIETKLSNPQYSSVNGTYNFEDLVFNYSSTSLAAMGSEFKIEADKLLEKAKPALKNYYDKAKELGVDLKTSGTSMPRVIFDQLGRKGFNLQTEITQRVQLDEKIIEELYNSKGVYYIQIKGKGLYYMGENPLNLPIPKLEGDVTLTLRIARSKEDKNGNVRPILRFFPDDIKITSPKSNFSIDTKAGIESLLNTEAVKELAASAEAKQEVDNVLEDGKKALETESVKKKLNDIKKEDEKDLSKDFNTIIEDNKGVRAEAVYSDIVARRKGRDIGRFKFFLPPGAEDFKGLIYDFLGKGKKGEKQFEFFDNNLIKPYWQAIAQIERFRRSLKNDYAALLKSSPEARVLLNKKIPGAEYSYDQAVRAYLMDQSGFDLADTGLSKRDAKLLVDTIKNNPIMASFAQGLQLITKQDTWLKPNGGFDVQTIQSDLHRLTSGEGRKIFLNNSGFMQNSGEIFSKDNLNKIEAVYGRGLKEALEDVLYRMKNGTNRPSGTNRLTNQFNNWVNRSIGAIMFFNRKSALLQTISTINFINWSDNNPLKAAMAFANQKQYWSDFAMIFNSPKLKERRAGLKGDINEAELASAVQGATNKAEAALSWLLKQGFLPTQMADSFAIASGGATFYRNRVNTYLNQGLSKKEAEDKAFEDFSRISEESQQSADPAMISEQQASPLGRLILAFQNTTLQYTRLMKRSAQDLINGRGDPKTHISKIIYYGAIQNFIFAGLQNALFAVIPGFDDEEEDLEEETKKQQANQNKNIRVLNNMIDTVLRGSGIYGAIASTVKNTAIKFYQNEQKDPFAKDNADILLEAINLSPPIGSKLRKLNNALKTREFEKDVIEERGWEITRDGRLNLSPSYRVFGSTVEAVANVPLERIIAEIDALVEMTDSRNSAMERIALGLGWRTWDLGVRNEESDQIKVEVKERKKREKEEERKRKREEEKRLKEEARFEGLTNKEINALKRRDQIEVLTKQQQVDSLLKLGLSKKEIRSLRLEEDRINKIIELNTK